MGVTARKRAQGRVSGSTVQGPVSRNENVTVHTRARTGLECVAALSRCKGISFANDWTSICWKPAVGEKNFICGTQNFFLDKNFICGTNRIEFFRRFIPKVSMHQSTYSI